jgi:glycosyltransferase involved in cell wall biosynthesis
MHALVLPSAEEAFGLVVVQALQCGVPCLVSDRVGAKDLIRPGQTGDIFPFGDVDSLGDLLIKWEQNRVQVDDRFPRSASAERLVSVSGQISGKDESA